MKIFNQDSLDVIKKILKVKRKKKKLVLCHGAFDFVHPGHLDHFDEAKKFGDILIVTITSDKFIKKSIHNPFFDEQTRLKNLRQIKIVDYCFIVNEPTGVSVIETLKPNIYCKGIEYKNLKNDNNLKKELIALKKNRGKVEYLGNNIKSSSKLISENLFNIEDKNFKNKIINLTKINFDNQINNLKKLNVLVIGETIIDEYKTVLTSGISPKSNTLSCIEKDKIIMPGGALATYKFVSSIAKNSSLISIINKESFETYKKNIIFNKGLIVSKDYQKIIKSRLIEEGNQVIKKIFTINSYEEKKLGTKDEKIIIDKINSYAIKADIIIVQDFGHGLFSEKIINNLKKFKKKISLNVQTNSLNYGFNIIGTKFNKANIFSLDERELQLYGGKKVIKYEKEMYKLKKQLKAKIGCLTLGDKYSLVIDHKNKISKVPKLNNRAKDTMGAGDIFHAMMSMLTVNSKKSFFNLFLAQIAGAHAVEYVGNSNFPSIEEISKTYYFYLNSIKK